MPDPGTAPDVPTSGIPANGPRFLIRARAAIIDAVISRHGMKAVMPVHDFGTPGAADAERVMLISGPDGMSAEQMDEEMDSDPDVLTCEFDRTLVMPELAGGDIRPALQTVIAGIAGAGGAGSILRMAAIRQPSRVRVIRNVLHIRLGAAPATPAIS